MKERIKRFETESARFKEKITAFERCLILINNLALKLGIKLNPETRHSTLQNEEHAKGNMRG